MLAAGTIHVAINDSPWLPAFRGMVELYEETTGTSVELHVFPYGGLYEKLVTEASRAGDTFDVILLDDPWTAFFFTMGYVTPLAEIDPSYVVPDEVFPYAGIYRWDNVANYRSTAGQLMGLPINVNMHLFYYRGDLFEEAGLPAPETWEDIEAAAKALYDPSKPLYGYGHRGQKGNPVVFNFSPVLYSHGGRIFANPPHDWSVVVNSPEAKSALRFWVGLTKFGLPGVTAVGQAELIAALATGKCAQAIVVSAGAWQMDDPDYSTIPGKMQYTMTPTDGVHGHAPFIGGWVLAIPQPISTERKVAAFEFIKWVETREAQERFASLGGIPTRSDVAEELATSQKYRYLKTYVESMPYVYARPATPAWFRVEDVLGTHLNLALGGMESPDDALDQAALEITEIMQSAGYESSLVYPLE